METGRGLVHLLRFVNSCENHRTDGVVGGDTNNMYLCFIIINPFYSRIRWAYFVEYFKPLIFVLTYDFRQLYMLRY